jgi:phosphomannomutase
MKAGRPGDRLVYGYEEALGYSAGGDNGAVVNDKDGIGTALVVAALAADAKRAGRTLLDLLDDQAHRYGLHATAPLSIRVKDLGLITEAMARLRGDPPVRLGGRRVEAVDDLTHGGEGLPPTDGLRFRLSGDGAGSARVVVRPSGTEPKLKCYLQVVLPVGEKEDVDAVRAKASAALAELREDLSVALDLT